MPTFTVADKAVFKGALEAMVPSQIWRDRALHVFQSLGSLKDEEATELLVSVVKEANPNIKETEAYVQYHVKRLLEPTSGILTTWTDAPTARDLERSQRLASVRSMRKYRRSNTP